mmetsp:Transcript_12597/g.33876  ORF Transcript_12597/g.33876 Transcript_12597/m.33876 type:complete len:235 (+) Transcript_12597:1252-1956(+)
MQIRLRPPVVLPTGAVQIAQASAGARRGSDGVRVGLRSRRRWYEPLRLRHRRGRGRLRLRRQRGPGASRGQRRDNGGGDGRSVVLHGQGRKADNSVAVRVDLKRLRIPTGGGSCCTSMVRIRAWQPRSREGCRAQAIRGAGVVASNLVEAGAKASTDTMLHASRVRSPLRLRLCEVRRLWRRHRRLLWWRQGLPRLAREGGPQAGPRPPDRAQRRRGAHGRPSRRLDQHRLHCL